MGGSGRGADSWVTLLGFWRHVACTQVYYHQHLSRWCYYSYYGTRYTTTTSTTSTTTTTFAAATIERRQRQAGAVLVTPILISFSAPSICVCTLCLCVFDVAVSQRTYRSRYRYDCQCVCLTLTILLRARWLHSPPSDSRHCQRYGDPPRSRSSVYHVALRRLCLPPQSRRHSVHACTTWKGQRKTNGHGGIEERRDEGVRRSGRENEGGRERERRRRWKS